MPDHLYPLLLTIHVVGGLSAFVLGAGAALLPKRGPHARWHRLNGQGYALAMLLMGLAALPLAWSAGSVALLVSGPLTMLWVLWGWRSLRLARQARRRGQAARAQRLMRQHVILMGLSYMAAWTAFLQNRQPFGSSTGAAWASVLVPALVGSMLIIRAVRQLTPTLEPGPPFPARLNTQEDV